MKHLFIICFLLFGCIQSYAQNSPDKMDTEELELNMDEALSEFQTILDTLDFSQLFGGDFGNLFGDALPEEFNIQGLDSLGGLNIQELFDGDMSKIFEQSLPQDFDMNQLSEMMTQSMQMLEQIDMSELQKMFEGMEFNFEGIEDFMPKEDGSDDENIDGENGTKNKKRKTKKI